MPDSIEEITERMAKSLKMSHNSVHTNPTPSTSNVLQGLNDIQKVQIRGMIEDIMRKGDESLLDEGTDHPVTVTNLEELNNVPDIVKSLREFSGKAGEFNSWRKAVERVLELFKSTRGSGRYYAILHVIRTKIVGDADTALESYRTPLDWGRIRKCLMMHYSDKRDIGTLEYQMTVLCQGSRTITEFYQAVYQHLSLILDKVSCLDLDEASLCAMTNTYREKALDTFVRGLNGDLPRLLSVREPSSLPQALHICLKLDNMTFRRNYAHGQIPRTNVPKDRIGLTNFTNGHRFYPELAHAGPRSPFRPPVPLQYNPSRNINLPMYNSNANMRQYNYMSPNPRPQFNVGARYGFQNHSTNYQKPSVPEPMEVDRSIRSRNISYANQPVNIQYKRPSGASFQGPTNKIQRNFHIDTEYVPEDIWDQWACYPSGGTAVDKRPPAEEENYVEDYFQQIPEEEEAVAEGQKDQSDDVQPVVNFLD